MSSLVKYRIREVAADFGMTPKEVSEIVGKYFEKPKSNTQVLEDAQLNVVFESISPGRIRLPPWSRSSPWPRPPRRRGFRPPPRRRKPPRTQSRGRSPSRRRSRSRPRPQKSAAPAPQSKPQPQPQAAKPQEPQRKRERRVVDTSCRHRQHRPLRRPCGLSWSPGGCRTSPAASSASAASQQGRRQQEEALHQQVPQRGAGEDAPPPA